MIAVDVGNTKTAIGFFRDGVLAKTWRVGTDPRQTGDQLRLLLRDFLATVGETTASAGDLIVASVVPDVTREWERLADEIDLHVVSAKTPTSYAIAIPEPSQLGADRIAALEAAYRKVGAPVMVVDAGTALTVSVIDRQARFVGGTIAPGIRTSLNALFASAARIREMEIGPPSAVIGSSTKAAVESGMYYGYAAMILGLIDRITRDLGETRVTCLATGGSLHALAPFLRADIQPEPGLTLQGLRFLRENLSRSGGRRA